MNFKMITLSIQNIELIPKRFFCGEFKIPNGQITKVCGDNGVGKSTFFSYCMDHLESLLNLDRNNVCFMSQKPLTALSNFSIKELSCLLVDHWSSFFHENWKEKWHEMKTQFQIKDYEMVHGLSGGQIQLIKLMISSLLKRELFFWDEPFQCLDPQKIKWWKLWLEQASKEGKTFVIIEHSDRLDDICSKEYKFQFKNISEVEIICVK